MKKSVILLATVLSAVNLVSGCAKDKSAANTSSAAASSGADTSITATLNVFAAASLKASFDQISTDFTKKYPKVTINYQYGGSGALATQIAQGAPADVFASADTTSMDTLSKAGQIDGTAETFAKNKLEIVVPSSNPGKVSALADLKNPALTIVTCAPSAACGKTQVKIEAKVGYQLASDSQESDVSAVLTKVAQNEADAGLVYVTDVNSAGAKVKGIPFPEADDFINSYPIGVVKASANTKAAQAFEDFVVGAPGQKILADKGFLKP
ncbi:MAG: molybdate ABC transporter substrate-binding protein [Antricoccus sp.]